MLKIDQQGFLSDLTEKLKRINFSYQPLYHSCSLDSMVYNLRENKISGRIYKNEDDSTYTNDMRPTTANGRENKWRNIPVVSLTRNKQYCIAKQNNSHFCIIEFDQDKLKTRYHIEPCNFWTDYEDKYKDIYGKTEKEIAPNKNKFGNRLYDEYEERIKYCIKNVTNYITKIVVYIDKRAYSEQTRTQLYDLKELCEEYNIPLYKTNINDKDRQESKRFLSIDKNRNVTRYE